MDTNKRLLSPKLPFYKKTKFIVLTFIFFPPVGVFLLFKFAKKPHKIIKVVISIIWGIFWTLWTIFLVLLVISLHTDSFREYEIGGNKIKVECYVHCSKLDKYSNEDMSKILAIIGDHKINYDDELENGDTIIGFNTEIENADRITIATTNNTVSKISNTLYPVIIYYSDNPNDEVVNYPSEELIKAGAELKESDDLAELKKKWEEEDKQRAEQVAKENLLPSEDATRELCTKAIKSKYPYGVKVHSVLGEISLTPTSKNTRTWQVEVSITNAFNATRKAIMTCYVTKDGDRANVNFNVN